MTIEIDTSPKALRELATALADDGFDDIAKVIDALAAEKEAAATQEPVIWAIAYNNQPYSLWHEGDGALLDCEVRRQGGTCHKMPLYLAPLPAPLPTDDLGTYYVSGPYHDGSMAVCRLDTGLVVHKFRLDGVAQPENRPTAAEVPLPESRAVVRYLETGGNAGIATRIVEKDDPTLERLRAGDELFSDEQLRTYAQAYADAVVAGMKGMKGMKGTT